MVHMEAMISRLTGLLEGKMPVETIQANYTPPSTLTHAASLDAQLVCVPSLKSIIVCLKH
jgi:hypothetical protein